MRDVRAQINVAKSFQEKYPDCRLVSVYMGVYNFERSFLAIAKSDRLRSFPASNLHEIEIMALASLL